MIAQLATHGVPVNRQASKVFWKSPWWAKLPDTDKATLMEFEAITEERVLIDYSKPPPFVSSRAYQLEDKRGRKLRVIDQATGFKVGDPGIVTGFHDATYKLNGKSSNTNTWFYAGQLYTGRAKVMAPKAVFWWCLVAGKMVLINSKRHKWWEWICNF